MFFFFAKNKTTNGNSRVKGLIICGFRQKFPQKSENRFQVTGGRGQGAGSREQGAGSRIIWSWAADLKDLKDLKNFNDLKVRRPGLPLHLPTTKKIC